EAAKRQAQADATSQKQRADDEEAAKRQAQADATSQKQRADDEEKARVLTLAATHPLIQGIVTGELKFYFDPLPTYAGLRVSSGVEEISTILSAWKPQGAIMKRVYSANEADLSISWIRDYGSHTLGESIYKAHIKVGLGTTNCNDEWRAFDANTVKKVLWHEIGHSMGYGHSSIPNNVMYSTTGTQFVVEQEISEIISAGWWVTIPLCRPGSYGYSFASDDDYRGFDVYVLPPGIGGADIAAGRGRVYTDCGKANMIRYSNNCNVQYGASIYLRNTSTYEALKLEGEIVALDEPSWPDMTWDQSAFQYDDADLDYYWSLFH
ncbi:MAG TPA: matrixin family metalloprotease, partial [Dehalococcoidia bacterium]|nr:matrixin family metalloprotease [Dehalococcoidia bacterium]